jgi:AcrR family transcriptional regulator
MRGWAIPGSPGVAGCPPLRYAARVRRAKLSATQEMGPGTRDRIVAVAEELIARHGIEGMQVKEIAARVGIRPPSVFAHFAGKDDIVSAVVERMLRRIEALFDAPPEGTPEEELRARTRRLVFFLMDNPADARIVLREWAQAGAPDVERYDLRSRLLDKIYGRVTAVLRRGEAEGQFRRLRAECFVAQLLGAILGQLAWMGWDVAGHPRPLVSRQQLVRDAEHLAVALVRTVASAEPSSRARTGPRGRRPKRMHRRM